MPICYRDRWFCEHYADCKHAATCSRPLTPEVQQAAEKWWGGPGAPISVLVDKPKCHTPAVEKET